MGAVRTDDPRVMEDRGPLAAREVLTVDQAAAFLQVHRITVYRYIHEGRLPAARLGKVYRVRRRDLEAFLDAMKHPHEADGHGRR